MIDRQNYHDVKKYLTYRKNVLQSDPLTITAAWGKLRILLKWADNIRLPEVAKLDITFPQHLLTYRADGKDQPLSPTYMRKICEETRMFFEWARKNLPSYTNVSLGWIDTLRPRKSVQEQSRLKSREFWAYDDVMTIARFPVETLRQKRTQAAICFLYLSGMRSTAFTTLRIGCVNVPRCRVEQLPEKGVITKNRKAAITFLFPIPEFLSVVETWDAIVRAELGEHGLWFPKIKPPLNTLDPDDTLGRPEYAFNARHRALNRGMMELCKLAEVPYMSPHKLRHGHGVYGVKHAKNVAEMKALSQNLMHANLGITDGIYGNLPEDDIAAYLSAFTPDRHVAQVEEDDKLAVKQAIALLQNML